MGTRTPPTELASLDAALRAELLGSTSLSPVTDRAIIARALRQRLVGSLPTETTAGGVTSERAAA